ncbi:hypothetical protein Plhal304r1_c014g0051811 [Plasmopara halstedii]
MPTTCIRGCIEVEDAKHLFWDCHVARYQWNYHLKPFKKLIEGNLDWTLAILLINLRLLQLRCRALRALWLYRNKKLYITKVTTSAGFMCNITLSCTFAS